MNECPICKKQFILTKDRKNFCSRSCQIQYARSKTKGCKRPSRMTGKNLICPVCEKSFHVPQWRFNKYNPKYCSRSCLAKVHLEKFADKRFQSTGKPHHQYKYIIIDGIRIREHRWLMQQHLGRKLERWEHVHHINGDSFDNRLENLIVLSNSEHQRLEISERKKIISSF